MASTTDLTTMVNEFFNHPHLSIVNYSSKMTPDKKYSKILNNLKNFSFSYAAVSQNNNHNNKSVAHNLDFVKKWLTRFENIKNIINADKEYKTAQGYEQSESLEDFKTIVSQDNNFLDKSQLLDEIDSSEVKTPDIKESSDIKLNIEPFEPIPIAICPTELLAKKIDESRNGHDITRDTINKIHDYRKKDSEFEYLTIKELIKREKLSDNILAADILALKGVPEDLFIGQRRGLRINTKYYDKDFKFNIDIDWSPLYKTNSYTYNSMKLHEFIKLMHLKSTTSIEDIIALEGVPEEFIKGCGNHRRINLEYFDEEQNCSLDIDWSQLREDKSQKIRNHRFGTIKKRLSRDEYDFNVEKLKQKIRENSTKSEVYFDPTIDCRDSGSNNTSDKKHLNGNKVLSLDEELTKHYTIIRENTKNLDYMINSFLKVRTRFIDVIDFSIASVEYCNSIGHDPRDNDDKEYLSDLLFRTDFGKKVLNYGTNTNSVNPVVLRAITNAFRTSRRYELIQLMEKYCNPEAISSQTA